MPELTDTEREMLAFERGWFKYAGTKATAVRERFGMGMTHYYQVLGALIDRPEALAAEPLVVKRLVRLREVRRGRRTRVG